MKTATIVKLVLVALGLYLLYRWWQSRRAAAVVDAEPVDDGYGDGISGGSGPLLPVGSQPAITPPTTPSDALIPPFKMQLPTGRSLTRPTLFGIFKPLVPKPSVPTQQPRPVAIPHDTIGPRKPTRRPFGAVSSSGYVPPPKVGPVRLAPRPWL